MSSSKSAPGVEVADEAGEPVLELHAPAVRPSVVDDEDAEISEYALQHAAAPSQAVHAPGSS